MLKEVEPRTYLRVHVEEWAVRWCLPSWLIDHAEQTIRFWERNPSARQGLHWKLIATSDSKWRPSVTSPALKKHPRPRAKFEGTAKPVDPKWKLSDGVYWVVRMRVMGQDEIKILKLLGKVPDSYEPDPELQGENDRFENPRRRIRKTVGSVGRSLGYGVQRRGRPRRPDTPE